MSTQKHNSYRKILNIQNDTLSQGQTTISRKTVIWCVVDSTGPRTIKTTHIGFSVYLNKKFSGIAAWMPRKSYSINIKNPLNSKVFTTDEYSVNKSISESTGMAYARYLKSLGKMQGIVQWFSGDIGTIRVDSIDLSIKVHACNIIGAKTWFPETACIYLEKGQIVEFEYSECGANKVTNGIIDTEKWNSIKDQNLAFRCNENGEAITGLFK